MAAKLFQVEDAGLEPAVVAAAGLSLLSFGTQVCQWFCESQKIDGDPTSSKLGLRKKSEHPNNQPADGQGTRAWLHKCEVEAGCPSALQA